MVQQVETEYQKWLRKRLQFQRDVGIGREFTAEEAKARFAIDIEPEWKVRVEEYEPAEAGYAFTYISPEGWEQRPGDIIISPEGEQFTRAEIEEQQRLYQQQQLEKPLIYQQPEIKVSPRAQQLISKIRGEEVEPEGDYPLLYKHYQSKGGLLDIPSWIAAGTPILPEEEKEPSDLSAMIQSLYPFPGKTVDQIKQDIINRVEEDPEAFVEDLYDRATVEEAEEFLLAIGVVEPEVITEEITFGLRQLEMVQAVFPRVESLEEFNAMLVETPDRFITTMKTGERTPEKVAILEAMDYTTAEINQIFRRPPVEKTIPSQYLSPFPYPETAEQRKANQDMFRQYRQAGGRLAFDLWRRETALRQAEITDELREDVFRKLSGYPTTEETRLMRIAFAEKNSVAAQFMAGWGDVIGSFGSAAQWLGFEELGQNFRDSAKPLQEIITPAKMPELSWSSATDPRFWAALPQFISRNTPFTLSLIPAMVAGWAGGSAVGTALGLSKLWVGVLGAVGGSTLSRPIESALEAGGTYDEAIARGLSKEEATKAANDVFLKNLSLTGLDAAQLAVAFIPSPSKLMANPFIKWVTRGGTLVFEGLTEAGEEAVQEVFQKQALGDPIVLDENLKQAMLAGGIFGLGMGTGGVAWNSIVQRSTDSMSPGAKSQFLGDVNEAIANGLDERQAILVGLEGFADTTEGQTVINNVVQEIQQQDAEMQISASMERQGKTQEEIDGRLKWLRDAIEQFRIAPERGAIGGEWISGERWEAMSVPDKVTFIESIPAEQRTEIDLTTRDASAVWDSLSQEKKQLLSKYPITPPVTPEVTIPTAEPGMPEAVVRPPTAEAITPTPVVTEELPTAINKIREEHNQVRSDVAAIRQSLKGKTDIGSRLTKQVLVGTERELAIAERLLSRVETKEELASAEITRLQERVKASINLAKAETQEVQSYKQALTDFINTLPQEVRGKMLASIKNVRTERGLESAANRALDLAEQYNQKTLKAQIRKEIKKARAKIKNHILKGRFTPDVQNRLNVLDHNLELDRDTAREKMAENIQKYDSGSLSYEEMLEANESLNFAGIDGMSSEELANTLEYIKVLETVGRAERQAKQEANTERIRAIRDDISNILTGGQGLKTGIGAVSRQQLAVKPGWLDTFTNWQYGIDNLADKLSKLDPTSKPYQSAINKFVAQVHRATNRQVIGTREAYSKVKDIIAEIYAIKGTREVNQALNALDEEVNLGVFNLTEQYKIKHPKATTITIKMTRDEMIAKYMQMQDYTLNDTFIEGMGWSQEVRDAIEKTLTTEEKKLASAIFNFYEEYYDTINPIYQELYNVDLSHNPNYSPIRRDFESDITENVLTFQDAGQFASVLNGSLKARQRNIRPLRFNGALKTLSNHIEQMEHFKAWATTMRDMRRVFGNTEIRQAIEQYHGRGISRLLDTFMNQMARGGIESAATNRAADYLRRNFTKSILAIKPVIALKQIPSLFAYVSEMNATDFFGGVADFWTNPVFHFKFLYNNSEMFKARMSVGFERDIRAAMEKHGKKVISGRGKFTDWFLLQIRAGDTFAVTQGMWAKYKAGLKQGLTQEEAIASAEDATGRTQPSFGIDTLSAIQNGGSWLKLMTMFQNQPNKYFRIVGDNIRNFKYGRGSRAKATSTILLTWVILPMMFQYIADAFQWKPERQARAGILGPLNYILIGGQLVQSMWGWLTDQPFDYQISPVAQTFRDLQMIFLKAKKLSDQGLDPYKDISADDVANLVEYLAKATGQVTGLPTPYFVQLEKLLRTKFEEGEEIEIKDFLFSQWALEPPALNAEEKVEEATLELGELKEGQEEAPLSERELKVNTTVDWFKKIGEAHNKNLPQDVLDSTKSSKESKAWAESEIARSQADILPDVSIYKINTDDNEDTIINYYQQWKARGKITSLAKLKEFDKLYPKAYLGNVSRQQYDLLKKYLEAEDKDTFFKEHRDELKINPRDEWLKDPVNARGAALLALRGEAKILSKETYNEFKKLINELDIPEDGIPPLIGEENPFFQLPEESVDNYIKLNEVTNEPGMAWNSWEAQIIWGQDDKLREFLGYDPIDTPIEALDLKIKNRANFDAYEELEAVDREQYKLDNPEWVDDTRRIEALENNGSEFQEQWVERGKIIDEHGGSSSEALAWLLDNLDAYDWATENELLKDGERKEELLESEPVLRINVRMSELEAEGQEESEEYLTLKRQKQGYSEGFTLIDDFVEYYNLPVAGFRQERYLLEHPEFAGEMLENKGISPSDYVPPVEYDVLLEKEDKTPQDELRIKAYDKKVTTQYIDTYVDYYSIQKPKDYPSTIPYWEDDWFLMENEQFYKEVYLGILGNQKRDFSKVPTREIGAKYITYKKLKTQAERDLYRIRNPDLDEWGVAVGIWSTSMTEKRRQTGVSSGASSGIGSVGEFWEDYTKFLQGLGE